MTARRAAIAGGVLLALAVGVVFWWQLRDDRSQAPANIRIVQSDVTGEQWIRWDDNSGDEAGFRGSVRLVRDGGVIAISQFNTPRPGESQAPVTPFDSKYAGEGCYAVIIRVEAVKVDGHVLPADEAALDVCIDEGGWVRYEPFERVPEPLVFPEPPSADVVHRLIGIDAGYQLTFENTAAADRILTTSRIYTEAGLLVAERDLRHVTGTTPFLDIEPGDGLTGVGCFRREFVSWTIRDGILRGWTTARQPVCLDQSTASFPLVDEPDVAVPAAATDVRVVKGSAGEWRIKWRDNSDNETAFELLVSVIAEGSGDFVVQKGVSAGVNETAVNVPQEVLGLPGGCYLTTVYVFSERFDTANGIPGNTRLRMCIEGVAAVFETAPP